MEKKKRPKKMTQRVEFRMDPDLEQDMVEIAEARGLSVGAYVRMAVLAQIARDKADRQPKPAEEG